MLAKAYLKNVQGRKRNINTQVFLYFCGLKEFLDRYETDQILRAVLKVEPNSLMNLKLNIKLYPYTRKTSGSSNVRLVMSGTQAATQNVIQESSQNSLRETKRFLF